VAEKQITIEAGKETFLDLSDVKVEEAVMGKIYFDVSPSEAKLYVDGKIVDHSRLQSLSMGLHQLSATADGYDSVTRYFNVGKETSSVEVVLESKGGDSDTEEEEQSQTEGCFIFVTAPVDVEVYFDGNYIGRCPVSVAKKAGSHTITIRKTGYETRTYTVLIENTAKDVYYSFDALAPASTTTSTSGTATSASDSSSTTTSTSSASTSTGSVSGNP
ncbi:MAG: PEGA domain-containing protein, partial [Lachnospiraceae bacterium]|nr:PEGA domain-containing protein [Lachnospiraceae bacterium]